MALSAVFVMLSININPTQAGFAAPIVGELLFGAMAGAGGIVFNSGQDARNAYNDAKVRFPDIDQMLEDVAMSVPAYRQAVEDGTMHLVGTAYDAIMAGDAETVMVVSAPTIASIFMDMAKPFEGIFKPDPVPQGETQSYTGVIDTEGIYGFIEGMFVFEPGYNFKEEYLKYEMMAKKDEITFQGATYSAYKWQQTSSAFYYNFSNGGQLRVGRDETGWFMLERSSGLIWLIFRTTLGQGKLIKSYNINIPKNEPYKGTVSNPANLITNPSAAVANVAEHGGVTAPPQNGEYTEDDKVGIRIPSSLEDLIGLLPSDLITDLGRVIIYPNPPTTAPTTQPTTQPTTEPTQNPTPQPTPQPTPNTPMLPPLPPILTGIDSIMEKVNELQNKMQNAPDDGNVAGALADLLTELNNIKDRVNNLNEDDPNLQAQLQAITEKITGMQRVIEEQAAIIEGQPDIYTDPDLIDQLNDVNKDLENIKKDMTAKPNDTTNDGWLEKILAKIDVVINGIKNIPNAIASSVSSIKDTVIGDMQLETKTKDDDEDDDIDITMVFPFCIPFDFARAITSLRVSPVPPKVVVDMSDTILKTNWTLDFAEFEDLARVTRWGVWISFFIGLMLATHKFIKW